MANSLEILPKTYAIKYRQGRSVKNEFVDITLLPRTNRWKKIFVQIYLFDVIALIRLENRQMVDSLVKSAISRKEIERGGGKKEKCGGIRDGWNRERRNVGGGLSRNGKDRSTDRNVQ